MLVVKSLDVDINGTPILRDIGLTIDNGEIIGLIGRNGAGKTTFLRSVMGLIPVNAGSVLHGRDEINKLPGYKRAHMGFGYMPEDRRLVPEMTAEQNILVPVWPNWHQNILLSSHFWHKSPIFRHVTKAHVCTFVSRKLVDLITAM